MELIINADDLGLTKEANEGIIKSFENKYCSQTTIVVNSDFSDAGAKCAFQNGFQDKVGLHLNLCEKKPLTKPIKEIQRYMKKGNLDYTPEYMNPLTYTISPLKTYEKEYYNLFFQEIIGSLREEIEAQIKKFFNYGFTFRHIDSHRNTLIDLPTWIAIKPLLKKYKFKSIRGLYNSFYSNDLYNNIYATWIKDEFKSTHSLISDYVSSIPKYIKNQKQITDEEIVELYVHPIAVKNTIIDNFTDKKTVSSHIKALGNEIRLINFSNLIA